MRVLFLHTHCEDCVVYAIHRTLAQHADPRVIASHFIWQPYTREPERNQTVFPEWPDRTRFIDFGRDLSLRPKPSRQLRAVMMFGRYPGALRQVAQTVRQLKPDLLYTSNHGQDMRIADMMSRRFGVPHLVHINYPVFTFSRSALALLLKADHLIGCSDFITAGALAAGVPAHRIITLFNPAELGRYGVPAERSWLRAEFGFPADATVIVMAGRLDPGKGHLPAIDAFARLHQQAPHCRLLVCGINTTGTAYDQTIKQRARELKVDHLIHFAGYREDLPRIFAGSDIFCLPTLHEAFGLVFTEAMAAGLPVVACRSGGVPEIVVDNETGLLSEPDDVEGLARSLLRLVLNPDQAKQMGTAGRARALTTFEPATIARQWTEALPGFANHRSPRV
jgi:glycosyltransferase involved in cell wall biosynthesis